MGFHQEVSTLQRLEATVHGHVQGVSFRYYTQKTARRLGVSGWVANLSDGTVRVVAEGNEKQLQEMVDFLHHGSPAARVRSVDVEYADATGEFHGFNVRYR
jgi:acylphosphatase